MAKDIFSDIFNTAVNTLTGNVSGAVSSGLSAVGGIVGGTSTTKTPCEKCSPTNFSDCITCAQMSLTKGLISIGVNAILFTVLVIGVLLLFSDEIEKVGSFAKDNPEIFL